MYHNVCTYACITNNVAVLLWFGWPLSQTQRRIRKELQIQTWTPADFTIRKSRTSN